MVITYILPDIEGGVASVVRNLLRYKCDRFRTKVILLHDAKSDSGRRIKATFNADELITVEYNSMWNSNSNISKKITTHLSPDCLVVSNDGGTDLSSIITSKVKLPVVYILHGDNTHYFNVIKTRSWLINGLIGVSKYVTEKAAGLINNEKLVVESIKFPVQNIHINYRGNKKRHLSIVFVGTLSENKGVLTFHTIINLLDEKNIPYHFTIVGDGPLRHQLEAAFKKNNKITFSGQLPNDEVIKLHANHDIIILPSKAEGLPVCLVEAMKVGVIPLASSIKSGIPELIKDGITGYKINIGEEEKYASFIQLLYNNPALREEMSQNCIEFANTTFNPHKQAGAYEDFYEKIYNNFSFPAYPNSNLKKQILDRLPGFIRFQITKRFQ